MQFILAILIYHFLFIADRKVTNKFKCSFEIQQKFYLPERLECIGFLLFTTWCLFRVPVGRKLRNSLDADA